MAYFNRAPDKKGLDFWEDKAQKALSRGDDLSNVLKELSKGFAQHPTFTSTYDGMSNREFVEAIYKNTLGKAGDEEGIGFWTDYLDGGKSRSDMVSDFVELSLTSELTAESFPNLTPQQLAVAQERQNLITNKVNVALSFTSLLGVRTNVEDEEEPESDPAYLASIKILSEIGEDDRSVSDTIGFLDSIKNNDAIDRINNPIPSPTPTITPTPTPTMTPTPTPSLTPTPTPTVTPTPTPTLTPMPTPTPTTFNYKNTFINEVNCNQIIDNEFILICYDYRLKSAKSVAYHLDGDLMNNPNIEERPSFYVEKSIDKQYRVSTTDYTNSGYDRGHLAPDAAFDWSDESLHAVYTLANIIPQAPQVNRNMWSQVEKYSRDKAVELGEIEVINVVKYGKEYKRIGKNQMAVSLGYYKVLYNKEEEYKECFYYSNNLNITSRDDNISKHIVDCDTVSY